MISPCRYCEYRARDKVICLDKGCTKPREFADQQHDPYMQHSTKFFPELIEAEELLQSPQERRIRAANNRKHKPVKSSKYKGVTWDKRGHKWRVHFKVNKKQYYLGLFESEVHAAKVYDRAIVGYLGKNAVLNFPE